jgi:hypothetical protein
LNLPSLAFAAVQVFALAGRRPDTMPFKSQAQRRKFAELLVEGKITPETFEEWNRETGSARLPERAKSKGRKKAAKRAKRSRRAARR